MVPLDQPDLLELQEIVDQQDQRVPLVEPEILAQLVQAVPLEMVDLQEQAARREQQVLMVQLVQRVALE